MSRSKKKQEYIFNRDVKGILLTTLGILMVISVFSPSSSGIAGRFVKRLLMAVFGLGCFIFPVLIILTGCCFIVKRDKVNFSKKFYGILLFIVNTLLVIQMLVMPEYYSERDLFLGIRKLYSSNTVFHGGIISFLIDVPLYKLFGNMGCYIIFAALYIISFIIISKITIYDILHKLKMIFSKKKRKTSKNIKIKENNKAGDEELESSNGGAERNEEADFIKNLNNRIKILDFMKSSDPKEENSMDKYSHAGTELNSFESGKNGSAENKSDSINEELDKKMTESGKNQNSSYKFPPVDLLNQNIQSKLNKQDKRELINSANKLEETLASFGVDVKVLQVSRGPSVTRFEIQPSPGTKVSKIVNLSDDIALGLATSGVRIEAPIPGKSAIGIEVPNRELTPVYLREVVESQEFIDSKGKLTYCLGKDIGGNCIVSDLTKMPHILIAGATGSGKSVCINTLIVSLLYKYSPDNVKFLMVDPKVVELSVYNGIPHLLIPVVTDPKKAAGALNWAVQEMNRRYKLFADNSVRNIEGYNELFKNKKVESKMPFVVIIIDELSDLMMVCPNEVEDYIGRLAQMARAAGMHLVIATQRPSVDVITGVIKANIPSRISFAVSSQIDSRTIIDSSGAEKLLGKGDMLFYPVGEAKPMRIQGAFISENEVEKVVDYIKNRQGEPQYEDKIIEQIDTNTAKTDGDYDELLDEAIKIVLDAGQASTSLLQRRLRIGYNRAARIMEQMEEREIISKKDGSKPRKILIDRKD